MQDYFSIEALSPSGAKTLLKSPARYAWERAHPSEPTPAMRFGTLVHCLVLEAAQVRARYAVRPAGIDGRTKEGKAALDAFRADAGDREIVDADDFKRAEFMADAVWSVFADRTHAEHVLRWSQDGVACKGKVDAFDKDGILDLKTTSGDLDDETLSKAIANYGYHVSGAAYLDGAARNGLPCESFRLVFVRSSAPHECRVVRLADEALEVGRRLWLRAVESYGICHALADWPSPGRGRVDTISLPAWAMREP